MQKKKTHFGSSFFFLPPLTKHFSLRVYNYHLRGVMTRQKNTVINDTQRKTR